MKKIVLIGLLAFAPFALQAEEDLTELDDSQLTDSKPNLVCGTQTAGRFKLDQIGPMIAGTYTAKAPGLGMTKGVQTFTVTISYERGRVYLSGDGRKIELTPVYGTRKELRYDPIQQKVLPKSAHAAEVTLDEMALLMDCDLGVAPQFTWTQGSGGRASGGVYSFLDGDVALGTMWNSAMGAREVLLMRAN